MSKQKEEYQAYRTEQQEEAKEQLASYCALKEWLKREKYRGLLTNSRKVKFERIERILDHCAELAVADINDLEEIAAQIEEELR